MPVEKNILSKPLLPFHPEASRNSRVSYQFLNFFSLGCVVIGLLMRPLISSSTAGIGLNLLISSFIMLALTAWSIKQSLVGKIYLVRLGTFGTLLLIWGLLVITNPLYSTYKFGSMEYSFLWLVDLILFYLVIQLSLDFPELASWLLRIAIATAFIIVLYGFYQYFFGLEKLRIQIQQNPELLSDIPAELLPEFFTRLNANEPFSTFLYQNSLGGYLVLFLPVILGLVIDTSQKYKLIGSKIHHTVRLFIQIVFLGLSTFIIYTTGSRGAWLAAGISFIIFLLLSLWKYFPRFLQKIIQVVVILILLLAVILFVFIVTDTWVPSILTQSKSLLARIGYWQATWKAIIQRPFFGVGLNNVSSYYIMHKAPWAEETIHTHNDFLEIWAELGLIGLIAFISIWVVIIFYGLHFVRRNFSGQLEPQTIKQTLGTSRQPLVTVIVLTAAVAFILVQFFHGSLQLSDNLPWLSPTIFYLIWLGVFCCTSSTENNYLWAGILAGIIGFLLHSTVDFNFYEAGLAQSIWLMAACLYATSKNQLDKNSLRYIKLSKLLAIPIILGITTIMVIIGLNWLPQLMKAERLMEEAQQRLSSPQPQKILEAERFLKQASSLRAILWPENVRPYIELASFYHRINPEGKFPNLSREALKCIDKAISLSPNSAPLYFLKGSIWETIAKASEGKIKNEALAQAIQAFEQACRLYPTRPLNFYRLGKLFEQVDKISEAKQCYQLALSLHTQVGLERLKLPSAILQEINAQLECWR